MYQHLLINEEIDRWLDGDEDFLDHMNETAWGKSYGARYEDEDAIKEPNNALIKVPTNRILERKYDRTYRLVIVSYIDLSNLGLSDIKRIQMYCFLQGLDLSKNNLDMDAISVLTNLEDLALLKLDRNKINSTKLPTFKSLMVLYLRSNEINKIEKTHQPNLMALHLDDNNINVITNIRKHLFPMLVKLSLKKNKLDSMKGIECTTLIELYLNDNEIKNTEGLEKLVNLRILHLRGNKISVLAGLSTNMKKLNYINLRDNEIAETADLKDIRYLNNLQTIIVSGNPVTSNPPYRVELVTLARRLRRINKIEVNNNEIDEANGMRIIGIKKKEEETEEKEWHIPINWEIPFLLKDGHLKMKSGRIKKKIMGKTRKHKKK